MANEENNTEEMEMQAATLYKYCHDTDEIGCYLYNRPQPYSRTYCPECGTLLFTTKA